MKYNVLVLGSGPGGYVAAIRAAQLGMTVAVVERAELGGICLNWGCIPTKALLKSAEVLTHLKHAENFGIVVDGNIQPNFEAVVQRSREVAANMSRGIQFLFKKNNIDVIQGVGKVKPDHFVEITDAEGHVTEIEADHIIIATGARSRQLPNMPQDGKYIIGYREALTLPKLPETMVVVGSGAIGSELASFYNAMGTKVTLVEFLPNVLPLEDEEVSKQAERSMKKAGLTVMTNASVEKVDIENDICHVTINSQRKGLITIDAEIVLSAVGVSTNIEGIGLEDVGISFERGKILVDNFYQTNISGYYAIGDIVPGPALAHVASHEALVCIENIAGNHPQPVDYSNIPGCTYITPEVASTGLSEAKAIAAGFEIKVGKFPFTASGKATAAGMKDGFVKLIFDAKNDQLLGAHLIGDHVTEMISELVLAKQMKATAHDIIHAVHPHPTMSEAVMEAAAQALNECVHL
ncbi:MAG: dihydrolipoyl dehydrogenase [Bacteroidales bacterium]|nr:dihydrolipoyl dehydrogenase [Bacteroidales bacterium]